MFLEYHRDMMCYSLLCSVKQCARSDMFSCSQHSQQHRNNALARSDMWSCLQHSQQHWQKGIYTSLPIHINRFRKL